MRVLLLATDVYGGHGGIALFNRNLVEAIVAMEECEELVIVPRIIPRVNAVPIPPKVTFLALAASGPLNYLAAIARLRRQRFDLVLCGHIHLLPVARALARHPILIAHGIEAWRPPRNPATRKLIGDCRAVVTVSELTRDRLVAWSGFRGLALVLPNAVRPEHFGVREKRPAMVARYQLERKRVLLTVGRVVAAERYKGFDEVIDVLPQLSSEIVYLIAGGGNDIPRLKMKASRLGVGDRVVFTGEFPESEKADLFALADVYVMPSRGEGFGFVFLEALASGVPVIGSCLDGGREALLGGELGLLVDPTNPAEVVAAIEEQLARGERSIPERLSAFSYEPYARRVASILRTVTAALTQPSG